jgi:hypothetical protein
MGYLSVLLFFLPHFLICMFVFFFRSFIRHCFFSLLFSFFLLLSFVLLSLSLSLFCDALFSERPNVYTQLKIQVDVFSVLKTCSDVIGYKSFGGPCCIHLESEVTVGHSETSVSYHITSVSQQRRPRFKNTDFFSLSSFCLFLCLSLCLSLSLYVCLTLVSILSSTAIEPKCITR